MHLMWDRGEWPASHPGRFIPGDWTPGTHWIEGWVCLRASLDEVAKRKIPNPCRESNPDHIYKFMTTYVYTCYLHKLFDDNIMHWFSCHELASHHLNSDCFGGSSVLYNI
jgi:hypothetical protein